MINKLLGKEHMGDKGEFYNVQIHCFGFEPIAQGRTDLRWLCLVHGFRRAFADAPLFYNGKC